jgi:spore germination cell wall hydrolase CwlJ-like protein
MGVVTFPFMLAGCTQSAGKLTDAISLTSNSAKPYTYSAKDKECLARAMFFESNRSSREGLVAVGTVVMNRLKSSEYGDSVCEVVGQKGQFAPGVMTRRMNSKALPDVTAAAEAVLNGERHPKVKQAMFFHAAGLKFPYKNMHYVLVAGGNAFYEKRNRRRVTPAAPEASETMVATAVPVPDVRPQTEIAVAAASPQRAALKGDRVVAATARPSLPAEMDTASISVPQDTMLSFEATPEDADAIGALIVSQDRPLE